MKRSRLLTIFLIVFIDLLGFSLILPLLPYYAEQFGANATVVGLLVASYAAASLIGAPLMGRLSDRYGRRPILLASVAGTSIGFLLLGLAEPIGRGLANIIAPTSVKAFVLGVLFFSRIVDGLTGGNITVAQAYISDVTDETNRAKGLGLIGAAFGLGFIIGPAVGGILSKVSYSVPAFVAAAIAALNLVQIFFLLPESLTEERRREMGERQRPPFNLQALVKALRRPVVGPLLHVRFFYGLAFATFQSIFALYAQVKLGLTADKTGYILAYVGILSVLVQGVGIGFLTKRFRETWLIITGLWLMSGALLAWAFTPNLLVLLIVMLPLSLAGGVLNTVIQAALTKAVSRDELGGTLGLSGSLEAITRVIAPTVGGFLLEHFGTWAPGLLSAILMSWAVSFAYENIVLKKDNGRAYTSGQRRTIHVLNWSLRGLMILVIGVVILGSMAPKPMPEALVALESTPQVAVESGQWLTFRPVGQKPSVGLILYPGGRVDYRSYAPAAQAIAAKGYLVVITRAPLNLAVLHPGAASDVIRTYPEIRHWVIGGHSLGGTMAATFADNHPGSVEGLVLWASYPAGSDNLSGSGLKVLSISASLDGLSTPEKIAASASLLPADTTWIYIQGGDHAQFGWYGAQSGDKPAAISRQAQQSQVVDSTVAFLSIINQ
jgi:MFS transporter, DHA1 family, tetracycline resistance protein